MTSQVGGPQGAESLTFVPPEVAALYVLNPLYISTLSQSDQAKVLLALGASTPQLKSPEYIFEEGMAKATSALLDRWNEDLKKIAEWNRLRESSPYFQSWLNDQSREVQEKAARGDITAAVQSYFVSPQFKEWQQTHPAENTEANLTEGVSNYLKSSNEDAAFMTAGLVIAAGMVTEVMMIDVASTSGVAVNPISDAAVRTALLSPADLQANLNLAINFFAMGMAYTASAEMIGKGQKELDLKQTSEAFAKGLYEKVAGNQVDAFVMALLVHKFENGAPITPERMQEMQKLAKAAMLMIGLAALYESSVGWRSGAELLALIDGKMEADSELEGRMVGLLGLYLGSLSEEIRDELRAAYSDYLDSRPSLKIALDIKKSTDALFEHFDIPVKRG